MQRFNHNGSSVWPWNALLVVAVVVVGTVIVRSLVVGGLVDVLLSADLTADEKLTHVRDFFLSFGRAAPIAYVLVVALEVVVAPIPGAMLYAPGGVIFGGFWGGLLSLAGNVAGAAIAGQLMRIFGSWISDRLAHKRSFRELQTRIAEHGVSVIFLLRVNPLTSSDMVSYAAGLTSMPTWKLCAGTALGMAPLCWIQAYTADRLLSAFPYLLYPLVVLCGVYAAVVVWVLWKMAHTARTEEGVTARTEEQFERSKA